MGRGLKQLGVGFLLLAGGAAAQPLPSGHPPVATATPAPGQPPAPSAAPAASAPPGASAPAAAAPPGTADPGGLPAGHPSVDNSADFVPPADSANSDPSLPAGTIAVEVRDGREKPLPKLPVRLGIMHQTVAEGESRESRQGVSDDNGMLSFSGLQTGSAISYRVNVQHQGAAYASMPFQLGDQTGNRVVLHVYPATSSISKALVGMRGFIYVQPRDDVFQFEVMFRVFNIGDVTWVARDVTLELPEGFKGFNAQESMNDTRFVADEAGARLEGSFTPGQADVVFRFQVPNDQRETAEFSLDLPPHVAEMRVMAESASGMRLRVEGFDAAEPSVNPEGQRILVTGKQLQRGEPELKELAITLSGIPTPGPGRWIAVLLAGSFMSVGLLLAVGSRPGQRGQPINTEDLEQARDLLYNELKLLKAAQLRGDIGPTTFETTKQRLITAIARLEARCSREQVPASETKAATSKRVSSTTKIKRSKTKSSPRSDTPAKARVIPDED